MAVYYSGLVSRQVYQAVGVLSQEEAGALTGTRIGPGEGTHAEWRVGEGATWTQVCKYNMRKQVCPLKTV